MELLSPAGSPEALKAAAVCGADAVYMGAPDFNARAGAKNFTFDELKEAVDFAHMWGTKVHVTLNTLISDIEIPKFLETVQKVASCGADALIVQDLGMASLIKKAVPDIPIHASTQMSVHSLDGVLEAVRLGASRVILARELDRENIAHIVKNSPVEIEVFAHGAMCMSHSGQCLFSAMIARRSGNRGRCGQPCRLMYEREDGTHGHIMSLKDMCLLPHIDELKSMGVSSLKIEGRLKRPEYVALVTTIYRRLIDEGGSPTAQEMRDLEMIFSRDGFSDGYFTKNRGAHMFGMHSDNSSEREYKQLLQRARALYENAGEPPKKKIAMTFRASLGKEAELFVCDEEGHSVKVSGDIPETAKTRPLLSDTVRAQLEKTGGTPYITDSLDIDIEENISMKLSSINVMRRDALSKLADLQKKNVPTFTMPDLLGKASRRQSDFNISISADDITRLPENVLSEKCSFIYMPLEKIEENKDLVSRLISEGQNIAVKLPRVFFDSEKPEIERLLTISRDIGVKTALCTNIGHISFAKDMGFFVRGDFSLNAYNSYTLFVLEKMGLSGVTLSYELMNSKVRDIRKPIETELTVYGRQELMITENCLNGGVEGCKKCSRIRYVKDRRGEKFFIRGEFGCRTCVLNGHVLYLLDKLEDIRPLGISHIRLNFTNESKDEISEIFSRLKSNSDILPEDFTRGLFYKGVM